MASSAGTFKAIDYSPTTCSPLLTGVYNPKAFILHAASRRQGFPHCERFSTAATRRCLDSVSVPVWLTILLDQLPVNRLGEPLPHQLADRTRAHPKATGFRRNPHLSFRTSQSGSLSGISPSFDRLSPTLGQVAHALLTLSPLIIRKS